MIFKIFISCKPRYNLENLIALVIISQLKFFRINSKEIAESMSIGIQVTKYLLNILK